MIFWVFFCFFSPWTPCFQDAFLFVLSVHFVACNTCPFVICPHYTRPCPFSEDQIVCAAQQTSESLWKADLVRPQPGHRLAGNSHIKELKVPASVFLIIFFCYFIQFVFPNALLFLKPFPLVASPLKCSSFHIYIFLPGTGTWKFPNMDTEGTAVLEMASGFSRMLRVCLISDQFLHPILSHSRGRHWTGSQWESDSITLFF